MKKETIFKFINLEAKKVLVWVVLLAMLAPFIIMIFFTMMKIQITGELPAFFDNAFFFSLFRVSFILFLPLGFLFEKITLILGYDYVLSPTKSFLIDLFELIFLLLYTYCLSCLAIFVWDRLIGLRNKNSLQKQVKLLVQKR